MVKVFRVKESPRKGGKGGGGAGTLGEGEEREGEEKASKTVFLHHLPPPRLRSLRKKMWARKSTRPIVKEFEMIDMATSPTRPSPSNVEPIVSEAYLHTSDID